MVKQLYIPVLVLFFLACRPDETQPTLVMNALLVDQQPLSVELSLLNDFVSEPANGAVVVVRFEGMDGMDEVQEYTLIRAADDPTRFSAPEDAPPIESGKRYTLIATWDGQQASASVVVPEPISFIQISNTSIPIDESSTGQPVFSVLWEANPGFSRLFTLTEPSNDPALIPFPVPSGRFNEQFRLPVPGQGTTLWDIDFRYYGLHELGVYTIDAQYDAVFFYTPGEGGSRLTRGPSNVENGAGVVAAASYTGIEIEILP
jgi:hypothetical protein